MPLSSSFLRTFKTSLGFLNELGILIPFFLEIHVKAPATPATLPNAAAVFVAAFAFVYLNYVYNYKDYSEINLYYKC